MLEPREARMFDLAMDLFLSSSGVIFASLQACLAFMTICDAP